MTKPASCSHGGFHTEAGQLNSTVGFRPQYPSSMQVRSAHLAIAQIDSDLALRLAFLPSFINTEDLSAESVAERERELRREAELAKQPHRAIISTLSELRHHICCNNNNLYVDQCELDSAQIQNLEEENEAHVLLEAGSSKLDLSGRLLHRLPSTSSLAGLNLVALDLSRNQLQDLPESIQQLSNLEVLDLQSNHLSKLPTSIKLLSNLKVLNVSGNMLKTLPETIIGCRSLVELHAAFNQLECIPSRIGHGLVSLECLSLHSNKLSYIPSSICNLRHLKVLDLHFNKLATLPLSIGNMKALEKLNISNNFSDFGGSLPHSIIKLTRLVELDLSSNQLKTLPNSIGALTNIKILKVENNPLIIPPMKVVEHSMNATLEYMEERWKSSQLSREEINQVRHASKKLNRSQTSHTRMNGSRLANIFGQCKTMDISSISLPKRIVNSSDFGA